MYRYGFAIFTEENTPFREVNFVGRNARTVGLTPRLANDGSTPIDAVSFFTSPEERDAHMEAAARKNPNWSYTPFEVKELFKAPPGKPTKFKVTDSGVLPG